MRWAPGLVAAMVFCLVEPFDVARLPALVDRGFRRRVEPKNREVSLAGGGGQPVTLLALGRLRTQVEVGAAVSVLDGLVTRAERRERLAVGETGGVLGLVERQRPEVGRGDVGGKSQAIAHTARQGCPRTVGEGDHVLRALAGNLRY